VPYRQGPKVVSQLSPFIPFPGDRFHFGKHEVERLVVQGLELAELFWSFKHSLPDRFWHFLGQDEQLVDVGVEGNGQIHEQLVGTRLAPPQVFLDNQIRAT
jgi:hypothetical protein